MFPAPSKYFLCKNRLNVIIPSTCAENNNLAFLICSCYNEIMEEEKKKLSWPLVGNGHIIDFLSGSVKNNNLAHTYIFHGPDNLGKTTAANFFAQILLCHRNSEGLPCGECSSCKKFSVNANKTEYKEEYSLGGAHGDLYLIKKEKDKKNISIGQIREFIRKLGMSSFLNSYKIGIIKHADSLSIEAANALLKTLEEPQKKVIIILVATDIGALPATVVSRGQVLKFNPVGFDVIYDYLIKERSVSRSAAKNFSRICLGRPALAVKFFEDKEFYDNYLKRVNVFLNFLNQDINGRLQSVEELAAPCGAGPEAAVSVGRILEIWLGLSRDLLLLEFNHAELIQHEIALKELMAAKAKLNLENLLNLTVALRQADKYIKANVSPKLVLERVAVSI